ncbi:MAG: hypothetical protein Q8P68_06250 [Candidatus Peregrinibacteria bacterium]|nr:hypothetical protein [Candidatus Peregrinibacteria bacterium]MDZ4245142.1 hypothetical protein [Candidatus Gracilibacteria bacterium]
MNLINFQEEFERIARSQGMGEAISSGVICHNARKVLLNTFPEGGGRVVSFQNGLLTINFGGSSALTRFNIVKVDFLNELNKMLSKNYVTEVKAVIGPISLD